MRVIHVTFFYDKNISTGDELLKQHYTVTGWAEALQKKGLDVIVMNRFSRECSFEKNGVKYFFVRDNLPGTLKSSHLPLKFLKKISELDVDIIHVHDFSLSLRILLLRLLIKKKTSIIIQHHGGASISGIKKSVLVFLNSVADGFFFTTVEQGKEWFKTSKQRNKIMPVMEGATFFNFDERDASENLNYYDRYTAREKAGTKGSPVFLWVGRLDENKDPLTVLAGFEILAGKYENANLYLIYNTDKLLGKVKKKVTGSLLLQSKVHLLGGIPHEEIKIFYNSADYFVLGSHYEGSGYALSEALRCGCVPVVTNIPSFKMMTNEGQLGALWKPGNKNSFVEAAISAISKPFKNEAMACIDFYKERLSFDAIVEEAIGHYKKVREFRLKKLSR